MRIVIDCYQYGTKKKMVFRKTEHKDEEKWVIVNVVDDESELIGEENHRMRYEGFSFFVSDLFKAALAMIPEEQFYKIARGIILPDAE